MWRNHFTEIKSYSHMHNCLLGLKQGAENLGKENFANLAINVCKHLDNHQKADTKIGDYFTITHLYNCAVMRMGLNQYFSNNTCHTFKKLTFLSINPVDPQYLDINLNVVWDIRDFMMYFYLCSLFLIDPKTPIVGEFILLILSEPHVLTDDSLRETIFNLVHLMCPNKIEFSPLDIHNMIKLKRIILDYYIILYPPRALHNYHHKRVLFAVDNLLNDSTNIASDLIVAEPLIHYFQNNGWTIDCLTTRSANIPSSHPLFDHVYRVGDDVNKSLTAYPIAIVVNHLSDQGCYIKARNIAKVTIGVLGHLMTSGVLDYYIIPHWDNVLNYSEKIKFMSGMAGGLPLVKSMSNATKKYNSVIYIGVPLTGMKINCILGSTWEQINSRLESTVSTAQFFIHMGTMRDDLKKESLEELHIKPYITNYVLMSDDRQLFDDVMCAADVILMPFPYSGYISVINMLAYGKPIIVLKDESRFSSQCAARILELFGLTETIAYNVEEYVDIAVKCITDIQWRESLLTKMRSIDYNAIIKTHNELIYSEFTNFIEEIL